MNIRKTILFIIAASPLVIIPLLIVNLYSQRDGRFVQANENLEKLATRLESSLRYADKKDDKIIHHGCRNQASGITFATDYSCDVSRAVLFTFPDNVNVKDIRTDIDTFFASIEAGPVVNAYSNTGGAELLEKDYNNTNKWVRAYTIKNSGIEGVSSTNSHKAQDLDTIAMTLHLLGSKSDSVASRVEAINKIFATSTEANKLTFLAYFKQRYDSCTYIFCNYFIYEGTKRDQEAIPIDSLRR